MKLKNKKFDFKNWKCKKFKSKIWNFGIFDIENEIEFLKFKKKIEKLKNLKLKLSFWNLKTKLKIFEILRIKLKNFEINK